MTLSLIPRTHVKKSQGCRLMLAIPVLGRCRQQDPCGSHQPRLLGYLQANERSYLKKNKMGGWVKNDTQGWWPLASTHVPTRGHRHTYIHIADNASPLMYDVLHGSHLLNFPQLLHSGSIWGQRLPPTDSCPVFMPQDFHRIFRKHHHGLLVNFLTIPCLCGVCALCGV